VAPGSGRDVVSTAEGSSIILPLRIEPRMIARAGPIGDPARRYAPKCLEYVLCELRLFRILGS
jgi:hypothetical protein